MRPDRLSRAALDACLRSIGYEIVVEGEGLEVGLVYYYFNQELTHPLVFDFGDGPIPRYYVEFVLEQGGVNLDAFYAQLDAL